MEYEIRVASKVMITWAEQIISYISTGVVNVRLFQIVQYIQPAVYMYKIGL
jgi:hypothetical protein